MATSQNFSTDSDETDILRARRAGSRRSAPRKRGPRQPDFFATMTYARLLRGLFCAAAVAMSVGAAVVWDASRVASAALAEAHTALRTEDTNTRVAELVRAAHMVESSWSQAGAWHAGAQEALSWTYAALDAQAPESEFRDRAILNAERTVLRAPIQPAPWTRLAVFDLEGATNGWCAAERCLENSWRAVELAPLATYCTRLRLADEMRMGGDAADPRVLALTRVNMSPEALSRCIDYMPQEARMQVMLAQQLEVAEATRLAEETGVSRHTRPYD